MNARRLMAAALLAAAVPAARAAAPGVGFGESMFSLTSARQAGSGGIALEDLWRQGSGVEATTVVLTSGLRWFGLSTQGGASPRLRLCFDGFYFAPKSVTRTFEQTDGSYGGTAGTVSSSEWGARIDAILVVVAWDPWRIAVIGRTFGLNQTLPDVVNAGVGADAGAQAMLTLGGGRALTGWALAGPLGWGANRLFASELTLGAGFLQQFGAGFLGGPEGFAAGGEGLRLSERLLSGKLGLVYWFGRPHGKGATTYLRMGLRYLEGTSQPAQPRAGLGILWRTDAGLGIQFDYAVAPMGEIGYEHFGSLGLRF